ncbi:hypothetical protein [Arthrobacter sp. H20]|uniref:DUF7793 family protein n=1 Tax=Arthrobacter sp. H20 TaxID=1267981 RepID=UPI00047962AD|nr:hypothetical protein [Arthrobacter sp. H20]
MDNFNIITAERGPTADERQRLAVREDGILPVSWSPPTTVTADDARTALAASLLTSGTRRILISMRAVAFTTAARRALCDEQGIAAIALVGEGPVDRVVAAFADNAEHPAQFFTSEVEAIDWLETFA